MPEKTNTYKLEYFRQGSYYSAESEHKRFLTLDYNLQSYIGVAGIGVIEGWEIESVEDLTVQILPGNGICDGYFAESPYVVKQRSDMVDGDREVEVIISPDGTPEASLTAVQRAIYVSVIQLYNPSFNPVGSIENAYVKVVVPTEIILSNNTDTYIYAERPTGATPYPLLNDYPSAAGLPPERSDYDTYDEYNAARIVYNNKLDAIHAYQWYDNSDNHFTVVDFTTSSTRTISSSKILLGRVVTRGGSVSNIDTSKVDSLANMESEITKFTTEMLVAHKHGGSLPFDPPKVRLETDIRDAVLSGYREATGRATFTVVAKEETSISLGHKHTYDVDENGDGQTLDRIGSGAIHFHKISDSVVGNPEESVNTIDDHIHTITSADDQGDTWTSDSSYVVYVNDESFADETSSNVEVDATTKKITFENGVSVSYNKYTTSFEAYGQTYTYTDRAVSVLSYMLRMIIDFNRTFSNLLAPTEIRLTGTELEDYVRAKNLAGESVNAQTDSNGNQFLEITSNESEVEANFANHPFVFMDSDGNLIGIQDLETQSTAAQVLLEEAGDRFTFTPNAANDITIELIEAGYVDKVTIEILGNVEVTGTLRAENILYLNADKILTGEFIPSVIPFISHIGRLLEEFLPIQYPLVSDDAIRYQVVPSLTDESLGHYHSLIVDKDISGVTSDTIVDENAVYYQNDDEGNTYFIAHAHGVQTEDVQTASSSGLLNWRNNVGSTITTSVHNHNVITSVIGDDKVIYAVKEDINGNIYVGTSDGFIIIPDSDAYQFVMNGVELYFYGDNLWDLLEKARLQYEAETGNPFFLTESVYQSQVEEAETLLVSDGDSVLLTNTLEPDRETDQVMIKKISSFKMPNFKYVVEKNEFEVLSTETIIETNSDTVVVERDFNNVPIWSIEMKTAVSEGTAYIATTTLSDMLLVGSNLIVRAEGIDQTPYQPWSAANVPFSVGVVRKVIKVASILPSSTSSSSSSVDSSSSSSSSSVDSSSSSSSSSIDSSSSSNSSSSSSSSSSLSSSSSSSNSSSSSGGTSLSTSSSSSIDSSSSSSIDSSSSSSSSSMESTITSDASYWLATNSGIFISRDYENGNTFGSFSLPGGIPDVKDIVEGERGVVYAVSDGGIFKTLSEGKDWTKLFDVIGGFKQIARDRTADITTTVDGHYHTLDVDIDGNGLLSASIGSGPTHIHEVSLWLVSETFDHTHTLIVTLYAVDNSKIIWKSTNNGVTWTQFGTLPDGEVGNIFAALSTVFVSQSTALYQSSGGDTWTEVFDKKVYSYEWSYDMASFFVGTDNILYRTLDGLSYEQVYAFDGLPSTILLESGVRKNFGYAYSNRARTFHFKDLTIPSSNLTSLVDFGIWKAEEGGWDSTDLYDVYVNYKRVYSTKYNEDKRTLFGYSFEVSPSLGLIDFGAKTTLKTGVEIYDASIEVEDPSGFVVGDRISVGPDNESIYADITAINSDQLTLSSRSSKNISVGAQVIKIPALNGDSSLLLNIYNSLLSNIGVLTHDQIEDGLSNFSDFRPYKFNDSYLSNLLQLTQAVRYVYPDINSYFINDVFYDFRYSLSQTDPVYPYIRDYIDVLTSDIYNQQFYNNNFSGKNAISINGILVGYGSFDGTIIVATDIGIFWARMEPSLEANWFYINDLPFTVNNIMIFGGTRLLAATERGTYYTDDMTTWTKEASPSMDYESYALGLRWLEKDVVVASSHTAQFTSYASTDTGAIRASTGTPYKAFEINQGIKVTNADDKNGVYIIQDIQDAGTGYGSRLIVSPSFTGADETKSGVVITMGTWWGRWDGDLNESNPDITNTLLVGGVNSISYNDGGDVWTWYQAQTEATDFIAKRFLPLSNGKILASAQGNKASDQKNYLFDSNNIGQAWDIFRSFEEAKGTIVSSVVSDFNNTVITVSYTQPENYVYVEGILDQQNIAIYEVGSSVAVFRGFVIGNEKRNGADRIIVYGNGADSIIDENKNYTFIVFPMKINTMTETSDETLFFGTDKGLYYDVNTVVGNVTPVGTIINAGVNGAVSSIDVSGTIVSLSIDAVTSNAVLLVTTDTPIRGSELIGKSLYITDTDPVETYEILSGTSLEVGGECTISIKMDTSSLSSYIGKRFRIAGSSSTIFVDFDLAVFANQFNNGTLYVVSNEYGNQGLSYKIISNGTDFINIDTSLVPVSSLVLRKENQIANALSGPTSTGTTPLQVGQNIRLVDSEGNLELFVSLDREVKENAMEGLTFALTTIDSDETESISNFTIISNLKNSITIRPASSSVAIFDNGNNFVVNGVLFEQLPGFSHLKTSIDSDHYHDVSTVGNFTRGKIDSFVSDNSSYVTFTVSDTSNFDIPLVQLREDLFEDAQIVFTNPDSINMRYVSEVVSHTSTTLTVRVKSASYWSMGANDPIKISEGWDWEIDATNYGYTEGIFYDDFVVITSMMTETASRDATQIKVESTASIVVGDKLKIQDDTLSFEINEASQIVDPTTINLESSLLRTFFILKNPQIKVLRDSFSNTHVHQVRNNEVEVIGIAAYLNNGYPTEHSHRVLPLIADVSVLLNDNNFATVFGSSSIIYRSSDNGVTWAELVDLNDFIEGNSEVEGISAAVLNQSNLITGATNGSLFAQVDQRYGVIRIRTPL